MDRRNNYHEELKLLYKDYLITFGSEAKTDPRTIANQIKEHLIQLARRYNASFMVADLEAAIADELLARQAAAAEAAIAALAYDPASVDKGLQELARFTQVLLYRPPAEVEIAVLQQFMWLVKRHLIGKPATHHIMPVVVGAQGSGKTETIKRLIYGSGLPDDLVLATTFAYLEDERNTPALSKHFIVFLDEMAKASRSDVNNLKRIITEATLTYRPMRTNEERKLKNNVTLIGASNQSIIELIKDSTGMRRYYELVVADTSAYTLADKNKRWKELNTIDFKSIWRSINEQADCCDSFINLYEQVASVQTEQLAASNIFLDFIAHKGYVTYTTGKKNNKKIMEALMEYRKFLQEVGSYADGGIDSKGLRRKFKDAGFKLGFSNSQHVIELQGNPRTPKIETEGAG